MDMNSQLGTFFDLARWTSQYLVGATWLAKLGRGNTSIDQLSMTTFREAYSRTRPALKRATDRLTSLLQDVVGQIEDPKLVRAKFGAVRPKSVTGLERKARDAGWTPDEALSRCYDLIGGRVVCNNVEDVYRFEALLHERLSFEAGPVKQQDYIHSPKDGYRALHVNFYLDVGEPLAPQMIPCEVQIRSRLQDAWAELSHADIYKHDDLPADLLARSVDLSVLLAAAEEIASDIRASAQRVMEPPDEQPSFGRVTEGSLAYIFKDAFGRAPASYVVAMALNTSKDLNIIALDGLPAILKRPGFRESLNGVQREIFPFPIDSETMLIAALHALASDDGAALRYVREQATRALDEIDDLARRELLSELPDTVEQLIDDIDDPRHETDVTLLAVALGVADNCPYCNATVIDPFGFSEAAMYHYGLSGDEADQLCERIQDAIFGSGVETGAFGDPRRLLTL